MPTESDADSTALVSLARGDGLELLTNKLDAMMRAAVVIQKSGLAGNASAEQVLAKILMGRELGMGPIASLRTIHVIEGRPALDASAQLARALQQGVTAEWKETTDKRATVVLSRGGLSYTSTWTIEMAQRKTYRRDGSEVPPLASKGPWRSNPEAMLRARAVTSGIRAFCPDVLDSGGALYSPDEIEDIGRPAPSAATWTPGEHHATFAAVSQSYAIELGDYAVLADWLESTDADAAKLRRAIAARVKDATLEQPWRPSWVPPRARDALLSVMRGEKGAAIRTVATAWSKRNDAIDVDFEPVGDGEKAQDAPSAGKGATERKSRASKSAKADAPKAETPKSEPDPSLTAEDADEMIEEIKALEAGAGEAAWKAARAELSLPDSASHATIVKNATNLARRYIERLGDVVNNQKQP